MKLRLLLSALVLHATVASAQVVHGGPADVLSWPETKQITHVEVEPTRGWSFDGTFHDWPNVRVFGPDNPASCSAQPDGCLQYTVWPVVEFAGQQHTCGVVQMWHDRPSTGAFGKPTWHDDLPDNWTYICGDMVQYRPRPGDRMGFFLTAGNARRYTQVSSVRERTNIVWLTLPQGDTGAFDFGAAPTPTPQPTPEPTPAPAPAPDLGAILTRLDTLDRLVESLIRGLVGTDNRVQALQDLANATSSRVSDLEAKPIPMTCSASAFGIPVSCKLR